MRFEGLVYRAHNPQWAWAPLSGEGARRFGGRFNPPGTPALYTALTPLGAIREASPLGRPMQPLTLCAYAVETDALFDATDPAARAAEGLRPADLDCPAWNREMLEGRVPASQALALRLAAAGYAALRVPSFAAGAMPAEDNIVFWAWGPGTPAQVTLIDEDGRLPTRPG
ncbi:RES domain-containing protein (plasmid) [Paroceanicella profunda]|uniref:RES domain-containing protein n=1 Tax=Paroceanicella profunda TaxID=2579971 RepID=A0A5B8G2I3_9RHOB|nr:RES domain-containing protein [Paroceanicella profunda]